MPEHELTTSDLIALVERVRLALPAASALDAQKTQLDLALARIASLTESLRGSGWTDANRIAARILLSDLALVASQLRGSTRDVSDALVNAVHGLNASLERESDAR
jgi:hypothetical protein